MSLQMRKTQVLEILSYNLKNNNPQLVPTSVIAGQLQIPLLDLHYVLKALDAIGAIQIDHDLRYSLITRKGLNHLSQQELDV